MQPELVTRAQGGDLDAYATLTATQTDRLYAAARLILRDQDRAADAVQDTLLQAWRDLRGLRDPERFEAWLHRILVRTCYASASRNRSRQVAELQIAARGEPVTTDSQLDFSTRDQLERGFARLSTEHRTVIVLVHYLGLSLAEAAQATGVPLGTIQSRLSRATQAMRAALEADMRLPESAAEAVR